MINAQHHALSNRIRQSFFNVPASRKILVVPGSLVIFHFFLQQLLMRDTSLKVRSMMKKNPIRLLFYL